MSGGLTAGPAGEPAAGGDPLLQVRGLRIASRIQGVQRVITVGSDFSLAPGETLGIVGESGSGKSMTARALIGLLPAGVRAEGEVIYRGRNVLALPEHELRQLRGAELAMVFQDPFTMLNPLMRCGAQIVELIRDENGRPLRRAARRAEAVRRLAEVGITDAAVADAYPAELSGGMRQRVGIAASIARDPQVLIADEPSTALDVTTQREILARLREVQQGRGMGLILITHDLRVAFALCDRVLVLYAGSVLETAGAAPMEAEPLHPYTLGLLLSDPPVDRRLSQMAAIPGSVPAPGDVAGTCTFAARCEWRADACTAAAPPLTQVAAGRWSACLRVAEIGPQMQAARAGAQAARDGDAGRAASPAAAGTAGAVVTVRDLEKVFGSSHRAGRRVPALKGVSLQIGADEAVGLVGESGSGKTTLGRCLAGLERPTAGTVLVNGRDATQQAGLSRAERRRLRRTVQMVFQDPYSTLNPARTIGATLAEAIAAADEQGRDIRAAVGELLERVGLPARYAERKPVALSGGERQRVAIARALAVRPRLIVCDEPVSALDVSVQAQILNLLTEVRRELAVSYLFITHDLAVVRQVAERVYVLREGLVVEEGQTGAVLDRPQHWYTRMLVDSIPSSDEAWLARAAEAESERLGSGDGDDADDSRARIAR
ncbi:MAG TPA: ABC transporter ATP-binding protein [Streptosporangiaceae bacterium]